MNPELPQKPHDELESSLTALLLGELPHEQAAALHQKLAQDAELAKLYERLKHTINLVRETLATPAAQTADQPTPLKLSDQRRQKLLQHFKTVTPKEFIPPRRRAMPWLVSLGIAAAFMVILGGLFLPALTRTKTRSQSLAFRTWSLSEPAAPALLAPPAEGSTRRSENRIRRLELASSGVQQPSGGTPVTPAPQEARPPAKPAGTAIVLPQATELADAVSTPTSLHYDSSSQRGAMGGGGGFGGGGFGGRGGASGGGVRGNAFAAEGQQKGPVAAAEGFRIYAYGTPLQSPPVADISSHTLEYKTDGIISTFGPDGQPLPPAPQGQEFAFRRRYGLAPEAAKETGASSPARQYPDNSTIGDAYFSTDPETRRVVNMEAPPPAAVPVLSATLAPAQEALGEAAASYSASGSALAPAEPALVERGLDVAAVRSQALGKDKTAAELTAGLPRVVPGKPAPDVSNAGELKQALAAKAQSSPNSSYYGGGAYGGYSTISKLPDSETVVGTVHIDGVGDVPVTGPHSRSEGEAAGVTQGKVESPSPQGTAANESFLRQANGNASSQDDRKALGFDFYLGNSLARNGRLAAQDGTAPSEAGQDSAQEKKPEPPPVEPAAAPSGTVPLAIKLPAPAFKGILREVPLLGDVPAVGQLFQSTPGAAAASVEANTAFFTTGQTKDDLGSLRASLAKDQNKAKSVEWADERLEEKVLSESEKAAGQNPVPNTFSPDGRDYANIPLTTTNAIAGFPVEPSTTERYTHYRLLSQPGTDANGASRAARSPIVLPAAQPETRLAFQDSSAADRKPRQVATAAGEGGGRLNELQIANGIAGDTGGNIPKGPATGEASERLERRRTKEAAKSESDESKKVSPAAPAPVPQPEVQTADNVFSTFSLNVSDVSFKLAAASLEKGAMPEPATVRSEEFINAFDYRDPEPPPGVPVAFAWERAQYPFAQNRDLLRFSIETAALGRQPGRPLNLVLLLDNSGSMERADRVRIIHEALRVLAGQLQPQDKFSVVTFARTAHLWVDGVPGNQAAQVAEEVSGLTPQGGTNLEDAMNLGYQTALRHYLANGINRVVLLTDGAANLGNVDPEALKQKVEVNRKQGIALDCFGIGWEGYNDDLLEVLTRNGDGRYGFVNTPEEAATEFAGQLAGALHVAAADVKVQVEFNPARVTAYRQIGYAKHQLTKEQFRDNTVNAAQIGAAESGNALYVVEVNPAGDGPLAIVRVRYRVPGTTDYHEHEWPVPYTGNAVALEQASLAMRLAATASAFSEWLVSSPYAGEVTPDRLLGYLGGVPEVYGADTRPKKLEWMIRQAKSIAGK